MATAIGFTFATDWESSNDPEPTFATFRARKRQS